jgi:hypothetical protein
MAQKDRPKRGTVCTRHGTGGALICRTRLSVPVYLVEELLYTRRIVKRGG